MEKKHTFRTRIIAVISFVALAIIEGFIQKPINEIALSDVISALQKAIPFLIVVPILCWWLYKEVTWLLVSYKENTLKEIKTDLQKSKEDNTVLRLVLKQRIKHVRLVAFDGGNKFFSDRNVELTATHRWDNYDVQERNETIKQLMKQMKVNEDAATEIANRFFQTYLQS